MLDMKLQTSLPGTVLLQRRQQPTGNMMIGLKTPPVRLRRKTLLVVLSSLELVEIVVLVRVTPAGPGFNWSPGSNHGARLGSETQLEEK